MASSASLTEEFDKYEKAILLDSLADDDYEKFQTFYLENLQNLRKELPDFQERSGTIGKVVLLRLAANLGAVKFKPAEG